ncbi:glycerophosphodiester phosphodiesterase [Paenibacillus sp. GCM10028914]|uniref:glycerophosphodiester phosphodiesterase n=1 Tax=Paenibacillus sp. GCM10028914 TaxID=3273416 RepID=UPI00362140C0
MTPIINFAHRGASAVCPENTMAAFRKALELGATGIETDVQMTKDGSLVLIHDETLRRTTNGQGFVKDYTWEEIREFDAGAWFNEDFRGERLPSLEELLLLTKNHGTVINIELKNGIIQYPGLEEKVIAMVQSLGMEDRVVLSSFNHYSLVKCKALAPEIRTGILYMEGLYKAWEYAQTVGADALHANKYAVLPEWVEEAKARGIVYHPFTVNDPQEMKRLIAAKVAGIITDHPDLLNQLLQTEGA